MTEDVGWRDRLSGLRDLGWDVLDWLSAAETELGEVTITACLIRSDDPSDFRLVNASAPVPTVADIFLSARWHERETAEMFGVRFEGHPDPRPLLLDGVEVAPLRKSHPLPARLEPWPGEVDPAKPGRGQRPPGTPWR